MGSWTAGVSVQVPVYRPSHCPAGPRHGIAMPLTCGAIHPMEPTEQWNVEEPRVVLPEIRLALVVDVGGVVVRQSGFLPAMA
ncbi:hypothetical protein GUJ93_ZPchr0458g22875 [Zizania palustris]|uniref:Uncharacterized protein n=1 Tax=Zizania palustris TaxID=103762 RepID=A0A8J5R706_ZIZPA|nr:hypothetical protein GUJ93_ZPchr0458g22875 [Zizania palustris]